MNGNDLDREKAAIPANLVQVVNILSETCTPPRRYNEDVEVLLVPRQEKKNTMTVVCVSMKLLLLLHTTQTVSYKEKLM